MRVDFCSGCGKLVGTDHPFGLCHDCEIAWNERARKKAAWFNTPTRRRVLIRSLQTLAVISGIVASECAYWILQPAISRMNNHPFITAISFVAGVAAFVAWRRARAMKCEILTATPALREDA
jgi:hypothetical protein